jgi:hypothetical protein
MPTALNLPAFPIKLKNHTQRTQIFDRIRKKYVILTPEEWVRQHFINYLIEEKKYPESRLAVEFTIKYNQLNKRSDIVYFDTDLKPQLIVECKAPEIAISQETFDQIARYNMVLMVNYLIVSNGLVHYCCKLDYKNKSYSFLKEIPELSQL